MSETKKNVGKVWLVGAGSGDIGLMTQKGMQVLREAEVVVYDALVSLEVLAQMPQQAEQINVGKRSSHHLVPQEEINRILYEKAKEGKRVVRLKGGDPFVFGRGGEELELLAKEQIPFEVVPGITSSVAVPAYNGIPVTHRDYTSSFHVITGHKKKNGALDINFEALVQMDATLVFLMGVSALDEICTRLIEAGMQPDMPAAILEKGTTSGQRSVVATVATLKEKAEKEKISSPAVIVVGKVCTLKQEFTWAEKRPLFGRQILVTRPKNKASELAVRLRKLGAQVVELPMIDTVGVNHLSKDGEQLTKRVTDALQQLAQEKRKVCITFTSLRGVQHFFEIIKESRIDLRTILQNQKLKIAVLGAGTRKELEQFGLFADYMPQTYSAKALGELLGEQLSKDTKVYLFRAKIGSQELNEALTQAGIAYEDIAVYETVYTNPAEIVEKVQSALETGEIDTVSFTSASTVKGFVKTFSGLDFSKIHAVCIGQQTAEEAKKHGMQITVAKAATMDAMIDNIIGG